MLNNIVTRTHGELEEYVSSVHGFRPIKPKETFNEACPSVQFTRDRDIKRLEKKSYDRDSGQLKRLTSISHNSGCRLTGRLANLRSPKRKRKSKGNKSVDQIPQEGEPFSMLVNFTFKLYNLGRDIV